MHKREFHDGSFVLHGITGDFRGRMSAWYDKDGKLLACEQIPEPFGQPRPVKKDGPMWDHAQNVGNRYKPATNYTVEYESLPEWNPDHDGK